MLSFFATQGLNRTQPIAMRRSVCPTRSLVTVMFVIAGLVGPVFAEGVTADTITIGQSAPLTGATAELGKDMKAGAEAYFEGINQAGGIGGRKLKLITLDDAGDPEKSKANTQKLMNEENVLALFGSVGAHTVTPLMSVVEKSKVPLIGPMSGDSNIRDSVNRYVFVTRAGYSAEAERLVTQLLSRKLTKIALFYQNDVNGRAGLAAVDRAMRERKLNVVIFGTVNRNSVAVDSAAQTIAKSGAQAVIIATPADSAAAFVKAIRKLGSTAQIASFSTVGSKSLVSLLGEDSRGVEISQVVPLPFSEAEALSREYLKRVGGKENASFASMEGYIAAKVLVEGIKRSGKVLTRETLVDGLEKIGTIDLGGFKISYSAIDHTGSNYVDLTVIGAGGVFKR